MGRGELLPLAVEGSADELYVFDVLRLSDALHEERSEVERLEDGRVMGIRRLRLDPVRVAGETIFRLRRMPESETLVTGRFVRRVAEARPRGLRLDRPVWVSREARATSAER